MFSTEVTFQKAQDCSRFTLLNSSAPNLIVTFSFDFDLSSVDEEMLETLISSESTGNFDWDPMERSSAMYLPNRL